MQEAENGNAAEDVPAAGLAPQPLSQAVQSAGKADAAGFSGIFWNVRMEWVWNGMEETGRETGLQRK